MGILAALVKKLQTGEGTRVESSLFQAGIDLQTEALTMYFARTVAGDVMRRGHAYRQLVSRRAVGCIG